MIITPNQKKEATERLKALFKFKPFSKKQRQILNWWTTESPVNSADGIIAEGSIRSGKTMSMSLSYVIWSMEQFNNRLFGLCGKTITSLKRNVIDDLLLMLKARGYKVREVGNILTVRWKNIVNRFEYFGGKDRQSFSLIQGRTLAGCFFDEVALMPENFVDQATSRCSVEGSKWWFNCNPDNPFHWFKTKWIDNIKKLNLLRLHFTLDDNLTLSEKMKERYNNMYEGVFYQRYILGLWVAAQGLIFSNFKKETHVIKDSEVPNCQRYYISIDYGIQNPMAFGLFGINGDKKYLIKEYHHSGRETNKQKDDSQYIEELKKFIEENGKHIEFIIVDPSATSFKVAMKKIGLRVMDAKNAVQEGIMNVSSQLTRCLLFIAESCVETIKEFNAYIWDEKKLESGIEVPIKMYDHHMDKIRYLINTLFPQKAGIKRTRKPAGW